MLAATRLASSDATSMQFTNGFDALIPQEMALRAEDAGVRKATLDDAPTTFVLAVLAGAFIALGALWTPGGG